MLNIISRYNGKEGDIDLSKYEHEQLYVLVATPSLDRILTEN